MDQKAGKCSRIFTRKTVDPCELALNGNSMDSMGTSISAYVNSITDLVRKLNAIGVSLSDREITDVLIFNLDNEYSSIAASLIASKEELQSTFSQCIVLVPDFFYAL